MKTDSLLLRQVHPNFCPEGRLSSQAFFPFPKDRGKLSVYDGEQIAPKEAFLHYTETLGNRSVGVWGVRNAEVIEIGLGSESDPLPESPAHALISFDGASDRECRKLAKKLKAFALSRGVLYQQV